MKRLIHISILCLLSSISFGQIKDFKQYFWYRGVCGLTLTLFNDKTYSKECGCEGSHYIHYGNWSLKKDTLLFKPLDGRRYKIIDTIIATNVPGDSITVVVLDKHKVNITSKITVKLFVDNNAIYSFKIDTTRKKKMGIKRENGKIQLNTLNGLFSQHIEISADNKNYFIITLNMPSQWIPDGYRAYWEDINEFSLLQRKGKLVSFIPQFSDWEIYEEMKE